jgi:hypothetical protein
MHRFILTIIIWCTICNYANAQSKWGDAETDIIDTETVVTKHLKTVEVTTFSDYNAWVIMGNVRGYRTFRFIKQSYTEGKDTVYYNTYTFLYSKKRFKGKKLIRKLRKKKYKNFYKQQFSLT